MGQYITKIIEQYNNAPDTALDNITPNQAISDPKKGEHIIFILV